jgi:hypothetical protein
MKSPRKHLCLLLVIGFVALLSGCASSDETDTTNGGGNQAWDRPMPWQGGIPGLDNMPGANDNGNAYGH